MTLRHLNIFLKVVEEGSMTAAADRLFITQPSVSQAINELEQYYGVKLFERLGKKLYITEAGKKLQNYAVHITELYEEARREMTDIKTGGIIRLGASVTIGTYILFELIEKLKKTYPSIKIQSVVDNTAEIEEMLLENKLDIGLVEGQVHTPELIVEPFMEDELVLVCSNSHPWAESKEILSRQLEKADFIVREAGSGTRELFESTLQSRGIQWQQAAVLNNAETIKNAVKAGIGVAVISRIAVEKEVKDKEIAIVDIADMKFKRQFCTVYHKNKYLTEAMSAFLKLCK